MKNLKTNLIAMAIGLSFSVSAIGQNNSLQDANYDQIASEFATQYPDSFATLADAGDIVGAQAVQTNSPAAAAANKVVADRLDALYEASKLQCANYAVDARAYCLNQMKAGFGR